jgi:alginate O-acetyltransferase complex protein AlgI
MIFNSFQFLLFFLLATPAYYLVPHKWRWLFLFLISCFFYASFIPAYILILFAIIIVDYTAGILMEKSSSIRRRKAFLTMSLVANIGVLAIFKYYNFFIDNVNQLLSLAHIPASPLPFWKIALPIGLSFHTFQAMSYTIEVYRGNQKAERHLGIYALYVLFYPQLVAGPIERPAQLLYQFRERHDPDFNGIATGLKKMLLGMFMKVVVADRLGIFVNFIFAHPGYRSRLGLMTAMLFYAFQIYCDFAGYSLIAIGSAKTMGFDLVNNFNQPFVSRNITEFWRRWHISLSGWFSDYLFNPLTIAWRRLGKSAVVLAIMFTFFISGLWHGAGWTFIVFGLLHGLAVAFEFLTRKFRAKLSRKIPGLIYYPASRLLTFAYLCLTWVFFRAPNLNEAFTFLGRLFSPGTPWRYANEFEERSLFVYGSFGIACMIGIDLLSEYNGGNNFLLNNKKTPTRLTAAFCMLLLILLIGVFDGSHFIYFQF